MEPDNQQTPEKPPKKGYGKHSVWFWVMVYVVAAVIVYGIIYLVFIRDSGGGGGGGINY